MSDDKKVGYTYADLHVGMSFRSPGRTITDADLVAFAGLTGDYSELHTSDVYARASPFGRRIAHGMLGLAYAHGLMWPRTGELRETAIAFLGITIFDVEVVTHDDRVVQHGRKALLVSKVPLTAVEASK